MNQTCFVSAAANQNDSRLSNGEIINKRYQLIIYFHWIFPLVNLIHSLSLYFRNILSHFRKKFSIHKMVLVKNRLTGRISTAHKKYPLRFRKSSNKPPGAYLFLDSCMGRIRRGLNRGGTWKIFLVVDHILVDMFLPINYFFDATLASK